ncbi:MAG: prolyl oligopeptidase family serine peptidase [Clostridia bacterium]|nr:prolyl oligopeptidase family serine peptidase [Clostridia bacterium]
MKSKLITVFSFLLIISMLVISCGKNDEPVPSVTTGNSSVPEEPKNVVIGDSEGIRYSVVYPEDASAILKNAATDLKGNIVSVCPGFIDVKKDSAEETEYEILLGKTNRAESEGIYSSLGKNQYKIAVVGSKIVIAGGCYSAIKDAVNRFSSTMVKNDNGEVIMNTADVLEGEIIDIMAKLELESKWNPKSFKASNGVNMPYQIYLPDNYDDEKSYPCILYMHSAGVRCTDNSHIKAGEAAFLFNLVDSKYKDEVIVIAPCCPETAKWVTVDNWNSVTYDYVNTKPAPYMVATMELFEYYRSELNIDDTRLYTYGMSMGGFAVWDLITRNPGLFAAAIPVAGAGDPTAIGDADGTAIWIFHGSVDSVVPVNSARVMLKALEDAGRTDIKYTEFTGMDHGIWSATANTKGLFDWLFAQQLIK